MPCPRLSFEITVEQSLAGRVLSDIPHLHGAFDPPEYADGFAVIRGSGPVVTLMDYPVRLAQFTRGEGAMITRNSGLRPCHNAPEVISRMRYDRDADVEHPAHSVFCAKGAGYVVLWNEAEALMYCTR